MYACDGHVYCSDRLAQIGYTTISKRLAHDVQHLLLRLGIVATIRTLKRPVYEGTGKVAREIRITSQESLRRFCELIPVPGKEEAQAEVLARLDAAPRSTNTDTLPVEIWDDVLLAKGDRLGFQVGLNAARSSFRPAPGIPTGRTGAARLSAAPPSDGRASRRDTRGVSVSPSTSV